MIPLAISIAILDKHTRLACLETDNPHHLLLAAISAVAAYDRRHNIISVVTTDARILDREGGGEDVVAGGNLFPIQLNCVPALFVATIATMM
jgi:hypothetical protein